MKKALKIIGIVVVLFIVGAIFLANYVESEDGIRRSIKLYNTSDEKRSVTFEGLKEDGTVDNVWYINDSLLPGESFITDFPAGEFEIKLWSSEDKLLEKSTFSNHWTDEENERPSMLYFDLGAENELVLINFHFLYSGSDLANTLSSSINGNKTLVERFKGATPFEISNTYIKRTFCDLDDKLPEKVSYGEIVSGLVAVPQGAGSEELQAALLENVNSRGTNFFK